MLHNDKGWTDRDGDSDKWTLTVDRDDDTEEGSCSYSTRTMNTNVESDEEISVLHDDDKWGQIGMKPAMFLKRVVVFGHSYEEQKSWHVMNIVLWGRGVRIVHDKQIEIRWNICSDKIQNKFCNNNPYFAENTSTTKYVQQKWQNEIAKRTCVIARDKCY